jgi:hypothetical protein
MPAQGVNAGLHCPQGYDQAVQQGIIRAGVDYASGHGPGRPCKRDFPLKLAFDDFKRELFYFSGIKAVNKNNLAPG